MTKPNWHGQLSDGLPYLSTIRRRSMATALPTESIYGDGLRGLIGFAPSRGPSGLFNWLGAGFFSRYK
jgi:hypothetical protein